MPPLDECLNGGPPLAFSIADWDREIDTDLVCMVNWGLLEKALSYIPTNEWMILFISSLHDTAIKRIGWKLRAYIGSYPFFYTNTYSSMTWPQCTFLPILIILFIQYQKNVTEKENNQIPCIAGQEKVNVIIIYHKKTSSTMSLHQKKKERLGIRVKRLWLTLSRFAKVLLIME